MGTWASRSCSVAGASLVEAARTHHPSRFPASTSTRASHTNKRIGNSLSFQYLRCVCSAVVGDRLVHKIHTTIARRLEARSRYKLVLKDIVNQRGKGITTDRSVDVAPLRSKQVVEKVHLFYEPNWRRCRSEVVQPGTVPVIAIVTLSIPPRTTEIDPAL